MRGDTATVSDFGVVDGKEDILKYLTRFIKCSSAFVVS